MDRPSFDSSARRYLAYVSILGTTQLHLRSPWVIAFWSAAFPGLGHLLLSKYLRGFLLFIWEVVINVNAHVNLALMYSFTGQFNMAKDVLDRRWLIMYLPTFLFAIWDSYRTSIDINHQYILASREDAPVKVLNIGSVEFNYLDKRNPWVAMAWSALSPGTGQLYIHRIVTAAFVMIWTIAIIYISKVLPAIHLTLVGDFQGATAVVDPQWFLNLPSVLFFSMYDAYTNTVENNKLFDWEQRKFLKNNYRSKSFNMPIKDEWSEGMYIVSTFEHSKYLEMAITALQMKGVKKEHILAVPMDKRAEERRIFDSIHHSDGLSLLDLPFILATLFTIFGSIYGFILTWGPVIWGLIGMVTGIGLGLVIKWFVTQKYSNRQKKHKEPEVVLIINCKSSTLDMVKSTLWSHFALGVSQLSMDSAE